PGGAAVAGAEEADAGEVGGAARVGEAGGDEEDRLVRVAVAAEDGDAAGVDAEGRAEVRQRDVGRPGRVEEVARLPDAAGGAGDVDGVARRVGRVDRQA